MSGILQVCVFIAFSFFGQRAVHQFPMPHDLMYAPCGPELLKAANGHLESLSRLTIRQQRSSLLAFLRDCERAVKSSGNRAMAQGLDAGKIDLIAVAKGLAPIGYSNRLYFLDRDVDGHLTYAPGFKPIESTTGQPFGPSCIVSTALIEKMEAEVSRGYYDLPAKRVNRPKR